MDWSNFKPLLDFGVLGIICAYFLYQSSLDKKKLFEIIEKNTKAFEELKGVIEKCQLTHHKD